MSTNSNIALEHNDGSVDRIYCHWDGYPDNNGRILLENYTTADQVAEMLALGDMSSLGENISETTFYARDREEDLEKPTRFNSSEEAKNDMEEFLYIFTKDGKWIVSDYSEEFRPVDEVLDEYDNQLD